MTTKYKGFWVVMCALAVSIVPAFVFAHPGRTDSSGCHTCKTNCPNWGLSYGEYHCHNAKAVSQPLEPIRSHYGENGTGYTQTWPAYGATKAVSSVGATSIRLKKGMSGTEVSRLQEILSRDSSIYPERMVTGYFGTATERAVMRLQKKHGLDQVGYVGPKTNELLNTLK